MVNIGTAVFVRIQEEAKSKAIMLMTQLMQQTPRFAGFSETYLQRVARHMYERGDAEFRGT